MPGSPYLTRPTHTALLTVITLLDHLCLTKKDAILERKLCKIKGLGGKDIFLQYSSNETGDSVIDRYSINKFEFDPCGMNAVIKLKLQNRKIAISLNCFIIIIKIYQNKWHIIFHFVI